MYICSFSPNHFSLFIVDSFSVNTIDGVRCTYMYTLYNMRHYCNVMIDQYITFIDCLPIYWAINIMSNIHTLHVGTYAQPTAAHLIEDFVDGNLATTTEAVSTQYD